jgi:hypothetical protein
MAKSNKKIVDNLIKKHGLDRFMLLMEMFIQGKNNVEVAQEFKITRERVRQLKNLLTTSVQVVNPVDHADLVYRRRSQ